MVIGGDFNCYDSPLELVDFKSDFHLTDVWRIKHPKERIYMVQF